MTIETFSRGDFERALPRHKETGAPLWAHAGLIGGEHTYRVRPFPALPYAIEVRSSVGPDNISAGCGEDSIRAHIVTAAGAPFGSKIGRWTTRVPGWQDRLTDTLRSLARLMLQIGPCDCCGQPCPPLKVTKAGANKGRFFSKCVNRDCQRPKFIWLES
jgi:hypothetical protein